jgi:anti-sigma regulatory factor (Ser/Thr protein kinase)
MRTGAAAGHVGHFHEVGFYDSDEEFRSLLAPFIEEGVAAGEPVVVGYDDRKTSLLRSWLSHPEAVTFLPASYATPAVTISAYREMFDELLASGAQQIRISGETPQEATGGSYRGWDRYESAVNTVWGDTPVYGRCLYDERITPADVRDVVERAHPWLAGANGQSLANDRYQGVSVFQRLPVSADPLVDDSTPVAELVDPDPGQARAVLARAARGQVDSDRLDDLALGVTEAVTNAVRHGRRPTGLRVWSAPDRVIVHVSDAGSGPADPLVGLVPAASSDPHGGRGLWLTHQLDVDVDLLHATDGFTVQLRAATALAGA